uniref:BTB domain-containing protein n=1 Tax=Panagrellus redivivus TaxID=6233 RepID=A0A7E4ZQJ9_PANRE
MFENQIELYLSTERSDVTLIVDGTKLPAHRSILSKGSDYFKTMFSSSFEEAKSNNVELKETNLEAFKVVLNYIYNDKANILHNGRTFNELFEVLACARYFMVDPLSALLVSCLKNRGTISTLITNALAYSIDELIEHGTKLLQQAAPYLIEKNIFEQLSPQAVDYVLKLPLNTKESIIFEALVGWMRNNLAYSKLFPEFLKHIDLSLLEKRHIDMLSEPTQIIDSNFCSTLLCQHQEQANGYLKVVNENVINNLRTVEGVIHLYPSGNRRVTSIYPKNFFTIDLQQQFLLNCIKFNLKLVVGYTVFVSKDMREWHCVIDHSKYDCFGLQVLYFTERVVRFLRIEAVESVSFSVTANVEALYLTDSFEVDSSTTLLIPKQNVIPKEMNTLSTETSTGVFTEGELNERHMRHRISNGCIVFQLSQPYIIGTIKLLLDKESSFYIEIITKKNNWTRIFSEKNVSGWRTATFEKQPLCCIKIVGTRSPSKYFHLHGLECYATMTDSI